jgi:hypothetical protein
MAKSACSDLRHEYELAGKKAMVLADRPFRCCFARFAIEAAMALSWAALLRKQVIVFFPPCLRHCTGA